MADGLTFDMQSTTVDRLMRAFPDELEKRLLVEGKSTAERIAANAQRRLNNQLGTEATGETVTGIVVQKMRTGRGFAVIARRPERGMVPRLLDKGTKQMRARPFFDVVGAEEEGPYRRRVEGIVSDLIAEKGLGD